MRSDHGIRRDHNFGHLSQKMNALAFPPKTFEHTGGDTMTQRFLSDEECFRSAIERLTPPRQAIVLQEGRSLSTLARAAASRSRNLGEVDVALSAWLSEHLGETSQSAKRAAVAAMAFEMDVQWRKCGGDVPDLLTGSRQRLAQTLRDEEGTWNFARNAAVASGAGLWIGALLVIFPDPAKLQDLPLRARRAAAGFYRRIRALGTRRAVGWLWETKLAPWAEFHLETGDLEHFSREGYLRSYRLVAACLKARPDLAGVFSASWLNDPKLASISPHLGFVERTGGESGAELIKLRTEPEQTAFAASRSPSRRRLIETGQYTPECFGLSWTRSALINWSTNGGSPAESERRRSSSVTSVHVSQAAMGG
jgi:hypothetical protein